MYVAKCPEVGTVSQGKTVYIDEAVATTSKEATELHLEEFARFNKNIYSKS